MCRRARFTSTKGVDVCVVPTLARGDGRVATMRHITREGCCYVVGVNPCVHVDEIPAAFPDRQRVWRTDPEDSSGWEPDNTVIVGTNGELLAGPARYAESVLVAELDLTEAVGAAAVRPGRPLPPPRRVRARRRHRTRSVVTERRVHDVVSRAATAGCLLPRGADYGKIRRSGFIGPGGCEGRGCRWMVSRWWLGRDRGVRSTVRQVRARVRRVGRTRWRRRPGWRGRHRHRSQSGTER
jgi:hypothetical protein